LTAFANDYEYENAFARWISIVGEPEDLLIALSGSGKSMNILKAVRVAESIGMSVWKEFGSEKGLGMQEAEEQQIKLGHEVMLKLRQRKCE
jgi:D-sedoheptulose 7-phosphate isomerase